MLAAAKGDASGHAHFHGDLGGHGKSVCGTPDAVSPKILSAHSNFPLADVQLTGSAISYNPATSYSIAISGSFNLYDKRNIHHSARYHFCTVLCHGNGRAVGQFGTQD